MNRKLGMIIIVGLIAGLSVFVVGCEMCCNSSQGSGSMVITDPDTKASHKATFSYRVECVGSYSDAEGAVRKISGRLEYQDHGSWKNGDGKQLSVRFHGSVDNVVDTKELADKVALAVMNGDNYYDYLPIPPDADPQKDLDLCSQYAQNMAIFRGKYTPQPKSLGDGGIFTIMVMDNGKPGPSAEDRFEITLTGGVFDKYTQRGVLAGGNVKAL